MGKVIQNYIKALIKRQVTENSIVVWYDPDNVYKDIINQINLNDVSVFKFEESYYDLRFRVEKYFGQLEKQKLLIYINQKNDITNF